MTKRKKENTGEKAPRHSKRIIEKIPKESPETDKKRRTSGRNQDKV